MLTDAAPGATVALVGGQRGLPMGVPAGSLCIGGGRRVIAHGQAGPGGAALLPWHPGAAGWTALSSGQFAVQALSQGLDRLFGQPCPALFKIKFFGGGGRPAASLAGASGPNGGAPTFWSLPRRAAGP